MTRRRWQLLIAVVAAVLALAGCGEDGGEGGQTIPSASSAPTPAIEAPPGWEAKITEMPPNGTKDSNAGLSIQVVGTCDSNNGEGMLLKGSGFPSNGHYTQQVTGPDKKRYGFLDDKGRFDKEGRPSHWSWDCDFTDTGKDDPPGQYKLSFRDTTPGSPTREVELTVSFMVD